MNVCLLNADAKVVPFLPLPNYLLLFLQGFYAFIRNLLLYHLLHPELFLRFCFFERGFFPKGSNSKEIPCGKSVSCKRADSYMPVQAQGPVPSYLEKIAFIRKRNFKQKGQIAICPYIYKERIKTTSQYISIFEFHFLNFTYYVCEESYCRYLNWYNFI